MDVVRLANLFSSIDVTYFLSIYCRIVFNLFREFFQSIVFSIFPIASVIMKNMASLMQEYCHYELRNDFLFVLLVG